MLKGKSAIVTGSTSGIGLGIAQSLARAGANVMLNGFGEAAEIKKTCKDLVSWTGVQIAYSDADMTKPAAIAGMVREAEDRFGAVDIPGPFSAGHEERSASRWSKLRALT